MSDGNLEASVECEAHERHWNPRSRHSPRPDLRALLLARERGRPFFPREYTSTFGRSRTYRAFSALTMESASMRVERGTYVRPIIHDRLGPMLPSPERIVLARARVRGEVVSIPPADALRRLGLTTHVVMQSS